VSARPLTYGRPWRRRVLAYWCAGYRTCGLCGEEILSFTEFTLDHVLGRAGGDAGPVRPSHRACNARRSGEQGKAARRASRIERHLADEAEREYWLQVNAARAASPPSLQPRRVPRIY
jgi:hypothetical protein